MAGGPAGPAAIVSLGAAQWGSLGRLTGTFYLLPTRAWELLMGAVIAFVPCYDFRMQDRVAIRQAAGLLGLVLIAYAVFIFDKHTPFPGLYALLPTGGAALIIMFATPDTIAGRILGSRLLVGIGLISYSAYLWHQPLFAFARLRTYNEPGTGLLLLLGAMSLVLAYFSWKYVETPFRSKQLIGRRTIFIHAAALTSLMIVIGAIGHLTGGFEERFRRNNDNIMIAKIDALDADRRSLIRAGECYFNKSGKYTDIAAFLANWDCTTETDFPALKPIPFIVVGDSHSADIVVALKLNGFLPLQMGGADCALAPAFMTRECFALFEYLKQKVADLDYEYIVLVNRLERDEMTPSALASAIDYWQGFGKKLIFLTGMPDFFSFEHKLATGIVPTPNFDAANLTETEQVREYLKSRSVHIINTREIFCSLTADCSYKDSDGNFLMVDQEHLSRTGARKFGEKLVQDNIFSGLRLSNCRRSHADTSAGVHHENRA